MIKEGNIDITTEERDLIFKGIRPVEMPKDIFKQIRKEMQSRTKFIKEGKFAWVSTNWVTLSEGEVARQQEKTKEIVHPVQNQGHGTYVRTTPRRHETLENRKWQEKEKQS